MKMPAAEDEDLGTFLEVIRAIDAAEVEPDKHCAVQMDDAVRDAIKAARKSGKAAEVTVKVKVTPGPERRVGLSVAVAKKLPMAPIQPVMRYADADGSLHDSDPEQGKFPFTPTPIRNVRDRE
jgi:hypothetical protein